MNEFTTWTWILAGAAAVIVGLSKTGIPGLGVFAVAIFANILPAKLSTGALLPLLIVADVVAVTAYRRHAVWHHLARLFPWVLAGIGAGYAAMGYLNDSQMRRLIGGIVLAMILLHLVRDHQRRRAAAAHRGPLPDQVPHTLWFQAVMGLLAGFTTMVANAAGPIMILYLLAVGLPKYEFLGTGAWFFLLVNVFKIPFSTSQGLITPDTLQFNLLLAPVVAASALGGRWIAGRINQKAFGLAAMAMAALAALRLLI